MDYTVRYGLECNPFLKNSKEIFVSTDESKKSFVPPGPSCKNKGLRPAHRQSRPWKNNCHQSLETGIEQLAIQSGHFKLLFNFEMDSRDRAVVLLSGLPSLNAAVVF